MKPDPWLTVMFRDGSTIAYPADSREKAEATAREFAKSMTSDARFGVYELRSSAVVETSARFEGMAGPDDDKTPADRPAGSR